MMLKELFSLRKKLSTTALLFVLSSLFSISHATPVFIFDGVSDNIELSSHYQLHVDKNHTTTIAAILAANSPIEFKALPENKHNLGYRPETHWFKVNIINADARDIERLLEFHFPLLDDINVYVVHNVSKRILIHYNAGDRKPFESRHYQHPNFVLPITLPAQSDLAFYFRIRTEGSMTAGATLWHPDVFSEQSRIDYFYINLYIGLLAALICYNFLLFITIREISYFYYVLFASSMLLATGSFNGLWFELFWPNLPLWHNMSIPLGFSFAGIFAALFSMSFLQTASNVPILDKLLRFIIYAFILTIVAAPFVSTLYLAPALAVCSIAIGLASIILGITLSLRGNRFAQIYLLAWSIFIFGILLFSARNVGFIPDTLLTRHGIIFGSALEMIILSLALAYRINFLRHEFDKSRQETYQAHTKLVEVLRNSERDLLARVDERTKDLQSANEQLLAKEEVLKQLAHYDPLTGLENRTLIAEQLNLRLAHCKREKTQLAVLFLDLDGFKLVNDEYGHEIGDKLLIIIAGRLQRTLRDSDVIGRLGGDEFIVILESGSGEFAPQQVSEKIKKSIRRPATIDSITVQVSISIGIACYPDDGDTVDTLMSISDTAMYDDKKKQKKARPKKLK